MNYPESLSRLIEEFQRLPGVGKKTAERYALYYLKHFKQEEAIDFAEALLKVKNDIKKCPICGFFTEKPICDICSNEKREKNTILVVEEVKDVIAIEKTERYNGLYHVLDGAISPINGVGPEDIRIPELLKRLKESDVTEVIIATNADLEGETTALYLKRILDGTDIVVSRIAYGVPAGSNLEYADEITLFKAIQGRTKM